MNRAIDTVLKYVIIASIIGTLFVPLVVSSGLYFPYITGKAFLFRLFVELGLFAYLALVVRDRSYLPKRSPLLWSMLAFVVVMGVANLNSVNPFRSFWSNFERMEGYITILHLFALWIIAATVLRTKEMWNVVVNISLAVSVAVGIGGFMDYNTSTSSTVRIAGTLGNSTYLGVYALVHFFLAGFMLSAVTKSKKIIEAPGRYLMYIALAVFNLLIVYNTGTRGSVVGIGVGIFVATFLVALFEKNSNTLRKSAIGVLVAVLVLVGTLGYFKESSFVKNNNLLYRFGSLITLDISSVFENQGRARTLLWEIAGKGVSEKPLLGWGQENFSYVFAKHYNPKIYDQEQWFDRTHNVFMDWLISGGFLGLLSYLALFIAAMSLLWRTNKGSYAEKEWSVLDKSLITGLLVAYFVHNVFVFDNLTSYILFFVLLAYVYNRTTTTVGSDNKIESVIDSDTTWMISAGVIAAAVGFVTYSAVVLPYLSGTTLINALYSFSDGQEKAFGVNASDSEVALGKLQLFKDALSYSPAAQVEINERLAEVAPKVITSNKDKEVVTAYMQLISDQFADLIEKNSGDPRPVMFYGLFLQKVGLHEESLTYIQKAIDLSPNKQSFYYQKGISFMSMKKFSEAEEVFKSALGLELSNKEAKIYYGIALMFNNKFDEAKKVYGNDLSILTDQRVLQVLDEAKQYGYIVEIAEQKVKSEPENPQYHISLASAYLKVARNQDAIKEIRKAIELAPTFQQQGEYYIKEIEAGRNPAK